LIVGRSKPLYNVNVQQSQRELPMRKTIVCVEDELDIIDLLTSILDTPSIEVISAHSAADGLGAIRRWHPALAIVDLILPDDSGWTVYDAVRADSMLHETPILLLTALRREFQPRKTFRDGPLDAYVIKPFDVVELRRQIERLLGEVIWERS
jgi:DNA-binding response OmpR family regulator